MAPPPNGPMGSRFMVTEKASVKSGTIKRFAGYVLEKYKWRFIMVFLLVVVSAGAGVAGSLFTRILIDDYIAPLLLMATPVFSGLLQAIAIMASIYLAGVLSNFIAARLMIRVTQGTLKSFRDDMFSHMQKLPIRYFDTHSYGDIMSHFTNDADTIRQMLTQGVPQMMQSVVTIVAVAVSMLFSNLWLSLIVAVVSSTMVIATRVVSKRSSKHFIGQQRALGEVNGFVEEMINGQKVIKVFCHEEKTLEDFDEKNERLYDNIFKANRYANLLMPIVTNLGHLQYALIAVLGGLMVLGNFGGVTLGIIASFLTLSRSFTMPITQISQQVNSVISALAGAERIFELLDEEIEADDGYVTLVNVKYDGDEMIETTERTGIWAWKYPHSDGTTTYTKLTGDVRFYDVDFGYDPNEQVLYNVTLWGKPGQKIAFVGATGAGKTTITNLINRFYDIADGKIRYDDININKIRKPDLRRSLGIVLQDVNLFTGTVMDNIRYGRLSASDEECMAAAELTNAHEFIMRLPDGYNTEISGDGGSLSQGQRQLISIARAAVADPPVMILDEATSSIDTRTEAIIQRGMDALMYGRTVFVIAHRLSTVQNSDAIIVLEHGHIIERGDHDELIEAKGKYYQLYTGALELE